MSFVYDQQTNCSAPNSFPGQLVSRTDGRGFSTCFQYDALNRLTLKAYTDGTTPAASYGYDNPNAWGRTLTNTVGRMVTASSNGNGEVFSYDAMGRVIRDEQCIYIGINGCFVTTAAYNQVGSVSSVTTSQQLSYSYNTAGNLTTLTSSLSDANHPGTLLSGVSYNALGHPANYNFGNGLTETPWYTNRGWLYSDVVYPTGHWGNWLYSNNIEIWQNGQYLGLGFAPNGNILYSNDSSSGNWTYAYDDFNRLSTSSCSGSCPGSQSSLGYQYRFDRFGNRWQQNVTAGSGTTSSLSFDANNRISGSPYQFDGAGDLLNDGAHSYTFDAEHRLTAADGGSTASYTYDAQGRRVSKVSSAGTIDYIYDALGSLSAIVNSSNTVIRAEINAGGRHVGTYANGTTYFSHTDWLGTERVRTAVNGSIVESCQNAPYGDMHSCSSTDLSPLHFTGLERDTESGLDHTWFRQYSSSLARWSSPDPAGLLAADTSNPQSWNGYTYVKNNPLAFTDPSGLCIHELFDNAHCFHNGDNGFAGVGPSTTCIEDGIDVGCSQVGRDIGLGLAAPCPHNNCTGITGFSNEGFHGLTQSPFISGLCIGPLANPSQAACSFKESWKYSFGVVGPAPQPSLVPPDIGNDTLAIYDARANALAHALNATGVQTLTNPCTPVAFYGLSSVGAVGFSATSTGAAVFPATHEALQAAYAVYLALPDEVQNVLRWSGVAVLYVGHQANLACGSFR
jgi:RHS repeat-associated protein